MRCSATSPGDEGTTHHEACPCREAYVARLEREAEALRDALDAWGSTTIDGRCPGCHRRRGVAHHEGCPIGAALALRTEKS